MCEKSPNAAQSRGQGRMGTQHLQAGKSRGSGRAGTPLCPPAASPPSPGSWQEAPAQPKARHHLLPAASADPLWREALAPLPAGRALGSPGRTMPAEAEQPRDAAKRSQEAVEAPLGAGPFPQRLRLHQHGRMRPPRQGKQRRDQTIAEPLLGYPRAGERSQPVWTEGSAAPPAPQRGRGGPRCSQPSPEHPPGAAPAPGGAGPRGCRHQHRFILLIAACKSPA